MCAVPGFICNLVLHCTLQQHFVVTQCGLGVQVVDDYSSNRFRLLALAVGTIPNLGNLNVHRMSQQQLESQAVGLELLALVVLTNHVRHDSKATISELQDG